MAVYWYTAAFSRFEKPALLVIGTEVNGGMSRSFVEGWLVPPNTEEDDPALKRILKMCEGVQDDLLVQVAKDELLAEVFSLARVDAFPADAVDLQPLVMDRLAAWRSAGYYKQLKKVRSRTDMDQIRAAIRAETVTDIVDITST